VIKNGGIHKVIQTNVDEKAMLVNLQQADKKLQDLRGKLRAGEQLQGLF